MQKKMQLCNCGHEAQDHDEGDDDVCLFNDCSCKKFSSYDSESLEKEKKQLLTLNF